MSENPGLNHAAGGGIHRDSHCDAQSWAQAAAPFLSAEVYSAVYPPWDSKMSISFLAE